MDYKEKYEMALERAKKFIEENPLVQNLNTWIKETFPELAESESERIRKALIHEFEGWNKRFPADTFAGFTPKEILAWLEKQGEQKPNPYSGTSFEYNGHTWGMCARDNGVDILCDKHIIGHLKKQGEQKPNYTTLVETGNGGINALVTGELPTNGCDEQKPAWSEEDEKMINDAISFISHSAFKTIGKGKKNTISWLKSLKDRVQPKQEWSEDDDEKFFFLKARLKDYEDCIIYDEELSMCQKHNVRETTKEFLEWLDSIKERMGG